MYRVFVVGHLMSVGKLRREARGAWLAFSNTSRGICVVSVALMLVQGASGHGAEAPRAEAPKADVRGADVRFGRDVLPILSQHCLACHGPDAAKREAELRLDLEEDAKKLREAGAAIVPGKADESELIKRVTSNDADLVMPPRSTHSELTAAQKETLHKWIESGAAWGRHWSFEPLGADASDVERLSERETDGAGTKFDSRRGANEIDRLVHVELAKHGMAPRGRASGSTLVRRLWLDLVGLPPTPELADEFAAEITAATNEASAEQAYERMVDSLLEKPQFGEHWGKMWLDLARYADTKGYEKDLGRTMWPYRDWVINALNEDMRLDRFTELQLAGDLLPSATDADLIATAFHRNTMSNDEGGTDNEEFRTVAVKDRVDTTVQVWMGLTIGCAKCHAHKYDPISMQEYYSFFALFNQTEDADLPSDAPLHRVITAKRMAERAALEQDVEQARARFAELEGKLVRTVESSPSPWSYLTVTEASTESGARLVPQANAAILVEGKQAERDVYTLKLALAAGAYKSLRIEAIPEKLKGAGAGGGGSAGLGVGRSAKDRNFVLSELTASLFDVQPEKEPDIPSGDARPLKLRGARSDFAQGGWPVEHAIDGKLETGWAVSPKAQERHAAVFEFEDELKLELPQVLQLQLSQQYGGGLTLLKFRISISTATGSELDPLWEPAAIQEGRKELVSSDERLKAFDAATPAVPIMRELVASKQRVTKLHTRGNFLEPGEEVQPGLPTAFHGLRDGEPLNRLGVARWLTDRRNPLTPRVWANRVWARLFGVGLVETEEDFGALGSPPSHYELLDWLAIRYRDDGWSLKSLLKTIVLSETYRQSSAVDAALHERDPNNRLLSRGGRYRLSAEAIRDQALAIGGLLSLKQGGPPVMPPQPDGLWRSTYSKLKWINAENEDRWRRSLYTYWKRTSPYPTLTSFDAGSREVCQVRRIGTNTPLQALVTLNDPVFVEAAGGLALRMQQAEGSTQDKLQRGMRLALIRPVETREVEPLKRLYQAAEQSFGADTEATTNLLEAGRVKVPEGVKPAELAAYMTAANAILNLDELLTRN